VIDIPLAGDIFDMLVIVQKQKPSVFVLFSTMPRTISSSFLAALPSRIWQVMPMPRSFMMYS
jgi:hypothetical protein